MAKLPENKVCPAIEFDEDQFWCDDGFFEMRSFLDAKDLDCLTLEDLKAIIECH